MGDQRSEEIIRKDISYHKGRHVHQAAELDQMERQRFSKASDIARLKKLKLQTKDKIARLEAELVVLLGSKETAADAPVEPVVPTIAEARTLASAGETDTISSAGVAVGRDFGRRSFPPVGGQEFRAAVA